MSILTAIRSLFVRYPKYETSAYASVYSAIVARLTRTGVTVGGTAALPRIEVHSITEIERLDKEGELRRLSLTVESVSNRSMGDAVTMNDTNLKLLTQQVLSIEGWDCIGVIPIQLQDLTETAEGQPIVYRLLQSFYIFIEKVKSDTPPPDPEETPAETPEPDETQDTTIETINN